MVKNAIAGVLLNMKESDLICIWNKYCEANKYYEDRIYYMQELDDVFRDRSASDLLQALDSDFSLKDSYFRDTVYGYSSFTDAMDWIYIDGIAEYIADNDEDFENSDIRSALDKEEHENGGNR